MHPTEHEVAELRARLDKAESTLRAVHDGKVDADDGTAALGADAAGNRFRNEVVAQMEEAVLALDVDGHIVFMNPAAERRYDLPASQALGLLRERLFHQEWLAPDDEAQARAALRGQGAWRGRNRHITRSGAVLLVESTLSRLHDGSGALTGLLAVVRDVSEQAATEAALRESRARLQFALASARIGEWDLDLASDVTHRSPRHDQCFGYGRPTAEWGLATTLAHVHAGDREAVQRQFRAADEEGRELHMECRVIWPDRSEHWVEMHGCVCREPDRPGHLLGIVCDITERKRAEAELLDADHRKDEFIATLAHELRNPLAPIRNAVQIMRLARDAPAHQRAQAMIERQLGQMVHLVDDLLDVSRISHGKIELRKEVVDIATVVRNAVDASQPLIDAKRHRLELLLPGADAQVDADTTRLTQVIGNLLNNATKYTPDGGRVTLEARADGAWVTLTVQDSGMGIPQAMLPRVFDLFAQVQRGPARSQGGLGIGLALVKRLIEMHGGSVQADSAGDNQGSTFTVRLPQAGGQPPVVPAPAPAAATARPGYRVLVVDDNLDSADSLALTLQLVGHQTAVAHSGQEALQVAGSFKPDAVLLDIGLPDLSGHEVARRLRVADARDDLLLVALTGWGQDKDRRQSMEAGFDHHLVKPVDITQLLDLLDSGRASGATL